MYFVQQPVYVPLLYKETSFPLIFTCAYCPSSWIRVSVPYRTTCYYQSEMLLLSTGTGGILYKPSYFHEIVFDRKLWEFTQTADDILFLGQSELEQLGRVQHAVRKLGGQLCLL